MGQLQSENNMEEKRHNNSNNKTKRRQIVKQQLLKRHKSKKRQGIKTFKSNMGTNRSIEKMDEEQESLRRYK